MMRLSCWNYGVVLIVLSVPHFNALAGDQPTAKELITAYRNSVEKLSQIKMECTTTRVHKPRAKPESTWNTEETIWRDDSRWKLDQTRKREPYSPDDRGATPLRTQTVVDPQHLSVQLSAATPDNPNPRPNVTSYRDEHELRIWNILGNSSLHFGRLPGDGGLPLWQILETASGLKVRPEPEVIDGHTTWIVESSGKYGNHKIWFDPECGGLPRRIEVSKRQGDLYQDEQIGSRPETPREERGSRKSGEVRFSPTRRGVFQRFDNFVLEYEARDLYVIKAFDVHSQTDYDQELRVAQDLKYRVRSFEKHLEKWPSDPIVLDLRIPEGAIVAIFENAPLEYGSMSATRYAEWIDGKVRDR